MLDALRVATMPMMLSARCLILMLEANAFRATWMLAVISITASLKTVASIEHFMPEAFYKCGAIGIV